MIGGLATGIASFLLIVLFIKYSLSYDKHYPDSDLIYRVIGVYNETGSQKSAYYPAGLVSSLKREYPEIEVAGRFIGQNDCSVCQVLLLVMNVMFSLPSSK